MTDRDKKRNPKNISLEGKKDKKIKARKTQSARNSGAQKNEFLPKEIHSKHSGKEHNTPKTTPEPMLLEREDYSYKAHNELTREEIQGYEKYVNLPSLSGEDFVKYISTPLKKKSALELGLSDKKAQGYYLKKLTVEELMEEKNKVKNELKYYDKMFIKKVGKPPSNKEKEPLK